MADLHSIEFIPLFAIFTFFLIISANFLAQLFPCRLQKLLNENMYVKHLFGFFTMIFFVILSAPIENKGNIYITSLLLYAFFIIITKVNSKFFLAIISLLGISYLLKLEEEKNKEMENDKRPNGEKQKKYYFLEQIIYYIYIIVIILTIIGLAIYMGEKKIEYKKNFDYLHFFFGNPSCKGSSPKVSFFNALKHTFD